METEFKLDVWLDCILSGLRETFGGRLLFAAHAGSWVRGEAGPSSDIDINVVLDEVRPTDIAAYRRILEKMPFREKACGFICGKAEMRAWPRHELFHFMNGCNVLHGGLEGIVAPPSRKEIAEYLRINASAILHYARHTLLYSADLSAEKLTLAGIYKSIFFMLQAKLFLESGKYVPTKKLMSALLSDSLDKQVFASAIASDTLADDCGRNPETHLYRLAQWAEAVLLTADGYSADTGFQSI